MTPDDAQIAADLALFDEAVLCPACEHEDRTDVDLPTEAHLEACQAWNLLWSRDPDRYRAALNELVANRGRR